MKAASPEVEPRKVPKQQRSRERFERILAAARALIAERGNDAVSMREIADASDVAVGSLYQYFPDKNALLWTLIAGHFERLESAWLDALTRVRTLDALNAEAMALFDAFVALCETDQSFARLWSSAQANAVLQRLDRELNERIAAAYTARFEILVPDGNPEVIRRRSLLMASLSSTALQLAFSAETDRVALLDEFRELLSLRLVTR